MLFKERKNLAILNLNGGWDGPSRAKIVLGLDQYWVDAFEACTLSRMDLQPFRTRAELEIRPRRSFGLDLFFFLDRSCGIRVMDPLYAIIYFWQTIFTILLLSHISSHISDILHITLIGYINIIIKVSVLFFLPIKI